MSKQNKAARATEGDYPQAARAAQNWSASIPQRPQGALYYAALPRALLIEFQTFLIWLPAF
jgi:hypothetical protein